MVPTLVPQYPCNILAHLHHVTFDSNVGTMAGAFYGSASQCTISDCQFINNSAICPLSRCAGAIQFEHSAKNVARPVPQSALWISRCLFAKNTGGGFGTVGTERVNTELHDSDWQYNINSGEESTDSNGFGYYAKDATAVVGGARVAVQNCKFHGQVKDRVATRLCASAHLNYTRSNVEKICIACLCHIPIQVGGGGVWIGNANSAVLNRSNFTQNGAGTWLGEMRSGGGFGSKGVAAHVDSCLFDSNQVPGHSSHIFEQQNLDRHAN